MKSQPSNYFHPARNTSLVEVLPLSGHMLCIDRGAMERRKYGVFPKRFLEKKKEEENGNCTSRVGQAWKDFWKSFQKGINGRLHIMVPRQLKGIHIFDFWKVLLNGETLPCLGVFIL
ncbi:hypothetical protein CEXT_254201 [Caerostris extrusa]|uniref:Uncharacterized protein n=1 Tax=Caerostris extrusa TaxID=172846 RepID=A0AAV4X415_CAEEX|nr:hypothetical protein CEXT_254201 [Caerostris extrusa]